MTTIPEKTLEGYEIMIKHSQAYPKEVAWGECFSSFLKLITAYRESQVEAGKMRNWNTRLQDEVLELQEALRLKDNPNG